MGRQIGASPDTVNLQGTVNTITSQSGSVPITPSITYPTSNLVIPSFSPTFTGTPFFTYVGATHSGSNWQIASDSSFTNILSDVATASALTSWPVANNYSIPRVVQTLFVRVRYVSNAGQMSAFSQGMMFRTDCSVATTLSFSGASNFNLNIVYSGTGTASSFNVKISTNSNMSSPVYTGSSSASSNIANISIPYTTLPGLVTGTVYYVEVTPAGADAIPKVTVNTLNNPASSVSGTVTQPVVELTSTTVTNSVVTATGPGTVTSMNVQYATSTSFSTITYTATSSGGTFAATNLPGLVARSTTYFARGVLVVGNDRVQLGATTPRVGALQALLSATPSTAGTTAAGYTGAITVYTIGGGGGGGGSAYGAAGGGGSGFIGTGSYTITTAGTAFTYTTGAGGNAGSWVNDGGTGGTTTFALSGQSVLSSLGGGGGRTQSVGGAGGIGGANGAAGGVASGATGARGGGNTGLFALGGLNGYGQQSPAGSGGSNYGAGGGGAQRDTSGSSSDFAGGGAGGLIFTPGISGGSGQYGNVTDGGAGARGACAIVYVEW